MQYNKQNNSENLQIGLAVSEAAYRIGRFLTDADAFEASTENLMAEFIDLVQADEGSIQVLRPFSQTTNCTLVRKKGNTQQVLDSVLDDFLAGFVLEKKHGILANDIVSLLGPLSEHTVYEKIGSILAIPLSGENKTIGIINLVRMSDSHPFTATDKHMVMELAEKIAPFIESAELRHKLFNEKIRLQKNLEDRYNLYGIIGSSPALKPVFEILEQLIPTDVRVVISGESGTGKELVARCIHFAGPQKNRPFIPVDCGALPPNLLESELFGYVKGAFTGAIADRRGLIEEADGGTLFLDEFTNMSIEVQAKLLRVIQEEEIRPIGTNKIRKVNVRFIAAASVDIEEKVFTGTIRSDLFYRLNVVSLELPPLRQRVEDIPALVELFLARYAKKHKKKVRKISPEAIQILERYDWPGNIRELENVIERAVVMSHFDQAELSPEQLPPHLSLTGADLDSIKIPAEGDLEKIINDYERQVLSKALQRFKWNKMATARALNTSDSVIRYKMNKLKIFPPKSDQ